MLRSTITVYLSACCLLTATNYSRGQESAGVLDYLRQTARDNRKAVSAAEGDSFEAWEKNRDTGPPFLNAVLGLPEREQMKAAVDGSRMAGDLVFEDVSYSWEGRAYVSATVIRSAAVQGRQPAIVMPPGSLGHHTFRPYRKLVESLARQGILVLFIDDPRTGRRHAPYAGLYAAASACGTPVVGIQVHDTLRGLDYLLTRSDVDPGKIGLAGLGEGAILAHRAAAMDPRFQFVVSIHAARAYRQAISEGGRPEAPSVVVPDLPFLGGGDRMAARIAPRPMLVVEQAAAESEAEDGSQPIWNFVQEAYKFHRAAEKYREIRVAKGDEDDAYVAKVTAWLKTDVLPSLTSSDAAPMPCESPEDPDFSMLRYFQRKVANLVEGMLLVPGSVTDVENLRTLMAKLIAADCGMDPIFPSGTRVVGVTDDGAIAVEQLSLEFDDGYTCPATLVRPLKASGSKCGGVILSHDDRQCAASARIADAARRLASSGYWVVVPEHASVHPQSRQCLADAAGPSFYGDEAARFYGLASAAQRSPLGLRVQDNVAAFHCLAGRDEVDAENIVIAGVGLGGVDACLAAVAQPKIAGVASVDATTMRDWLTNVAPDELRFFHIMPFLPAMLDAFDLDLCYGVVAPRPLLLVRQKDGWPRSGFEQVAATASGYYKLSQAEKELLVLGPRDVTEDLEAKTPAGIQKALVSAARTLLPTPPQAGVVGTVDQLRSRTNVDSAVGLIWIVAEMSGYDQEFVDEGYTLQSWSFFNDNGAAEKGRVITPLIFRKEGDKYVLTGIGKTRTNEGTGVQPHEFEAAEGTGIVGENHFFGWHTGDCDGQNNPGVVEYQDVPDARMIILTADGQMNNQKPAVGDTYRLQSQYPRQYSVMAVSKKP
jgi:dienelactone hydrolase